jgi:hypothetical protein
MRPGVFGMGMSNHAHDHNISFRLIRATHPDRGCSASSLDPAVLRILGALLLFFCLILLQACSLPALIPVEVTPDGAVRLPSEEGILLRAYRPEISLELNWSEGSPASTMVTVQNVAASNIELKVTPTGGQKAASVTARVISNTVLFLEIDGGEGKQVIELFLRPLDTGKAITFAVLGDSQGKNDILAAIIEEINGSGAQFLIHLGDMVPSGREEEYLEFLETMAFLNIPYYTVPGNHDVKWDGLALYQKLLAPPVYYFDYFDLRLIFLDSSLLGLGQEQLVWLDDLLSDSSRDALLFHHVPPVDPRGKEHSFLDVAEAQQFLELAASKNTPVLGMFSGHIHMFYCKILNGMTYVVSGGGGANLYASPGEGGYHHYTLVSFSEDGLLQVEPYPVEPPTRSLEISVYGREGERDFTAAELNKMANFTREGSFQNVHGNFRSEGLYRGIPVSKLVEAVGGMEPGDNLLVISRDGYTQLYAYENVYPRAAGWYGYQGEMVLAIEYNGSSPPEWQDGYRITFLPEDGVYDNEDCARTSAPGQGWHLYESAGARWVRAVTRLEVIP